MALPGAAPIQALHGVPVDDHAGLASEYYGPGVKEHVHYGLGRDIPRPDIFFQGEAYYRIYSLFIEIFHRLGLRVFDIFLSFSTSSLLSDLYSPSLRFPTESPAYRSRERLMTFAPTALIIIFTCLLRPS